MKPHTITYLSTVNEVFYNYIWNAWNSSSQYEWSGWSKIPHYITHLLTNSNVEPLKILDIGAGSCRFVEFISKHTTRSIEYHALDFYFPPQAYELSKQYNCTFYTNNIIFEKLTEICKNQSFDIIVAFGVFHHIPSRALRQSIFNDISKLLKPKGVCIATHWMFKDVKRIHKNIISDVSLFPQDIIKDLEEHDHFVLGGTQKKVFRYSHYITPLEMNHISSSLSIQHSYIDDGKYRNTNHYYILTSL